MKYLLLLLTLNFLSCGRYYEVIHPMRHQKPCYKKHFSTMAIIMYDDFLRKGFIESDAVYLTNRNIGRIMLNTDILYLDMCVCAGKTIDEYHDVKKRGQ